jgi:hypothetical protein
MNSNDVNSIINNLCDKLGTTASKLIPEMAGYQIAKYSILLVISLLFIGVSIGFTIRLIWMRKKNQEALAIYPNRVRELDEIFRKTKVYNEQLDNFSRAQWADVVNKAKSAIGWMEWDESTWLAMVMTAVWSGLIGIVIFGIALYHIIGWSIVPNASAFMWIIGQLGGGQ